MELTQEFFYRVKTTGPLKATKGSPVGERNYWIVSDAQIDGPRIKARIAAPGSDWMRVADDGFWRPDVRVPFQTDDVETVLMHYTGLVQQTDVFKQAAEANKSTEWGDQYMRLAMRFDTGAERYGGSIRRCSSPRAVCLGLVVSSTPSTASREGRGQKSESAPGRDPTVTAPLSHAHGWQASRGGQATDSGRHCVITTHASVTTAYGGTGVHGT
jgi:hypothetical protein